MGMTSMQLKDALAYSAGMAILSSEKGETTATAVREWPHGIAKLLRRIFAMTLAQQKRLLGVKVSWSEEGLYRYEEKAFMSAYASIKAVWRFDGFSPLRFEPRTGTSMEAWALNERLNTFPCSDRMREGIAEAALSGGGIAIKR